MNTRALITKSFVSYAQSEGDYIEYVSSLNGVRAGFLEMEIANATTDIDHGLSCIEGLLSEPKSLSSMSQVGNIRTQIRKLKTQRSNLSKTLDCIPTGEADIKRQFAQAWNVPRISSMWLEDSRLAYRTLPLFGQDHEKRWRRIGPFEISFDLSDIKLENFIWVNLDGAKHNMHGPPNIEETQWEEYGTVKCAGDGQIVIDEAAEINDFPALVAFSVRYAECAGQDKTETIYRWPLADINDVPKWYLTEFAA